MMFIGHMIQIYIDHNQNAPFKFSVASMHNAVLETDSGMWGLCFVL
jgi:hypothetical protein